MVTQPVSQLELVPVSVCCSDHAWEVLQADSHLPVLAIPTDLIFLDSQEGFCHEPGPLCSGQGGSAGS